MAHRALQLVSRGLYPPVPVGELIPDTYLDSLGQEQPVDFERLVALGAAEKVSTRAKGKKAADDAGQAEPAEGSDQAEPADPEQPPAQ